MVRTETMAVLSSRLAAALAVLVVGGAGVLPAQAARTVAVGGAVTEILYALGRDGDVVAVDSTSLYPERALHEKANIGYFRALSAEGVLSVRPDRVIAIDGAGPKAALSAVQNAGVEIVEAPNELTPEGVARKIRAVGAAVEAQPAAEALATEVLRRFADLANLRAAVVQRKRVLFAMSIENGRVLAGGRGTAADALIDLAGAVNAAAFDGYKPMSDEALAAAAPEAIVLMQRPGESLVDSVVALPAVAQTPAGRERAVYGFDGLYAVGFGPREPEAARELLVKLYPALAAAPSPGAAEGKGP